MVLLDKQNDHDQNLQLPLKLRRLRLELCLSIPLLMKRVHTPACDCLRIFLSVPGYRLRFFIVMQVQHFYILSINE